MEIVSGILRGMPLWSPSGLTARPTAVRARQALFDSLGELDGLAVADLFAGTGAVGLEAASRGAASVLFVDAQKSSCNTIKANCAKAETIAETAGFEILSGTLPLCCKRLAAHAKPDLIFADPPYAESMGLLAGMLADRDFSEWASNALLIWEAPSNKGGLTPPPPHWKLETIREFGGAKFLFLRRNPEA